MTGAARGGARDRIGGRAGLAARERLLARTASTCASSRCRAPTCSTGRTPRIARRCCRAAFRAWRSRPGDGFLAQIRGRQRRRHAAVVGIDTFGESAPAPVLFKHFGFTPERVVAAVPHGHEQRGHSMLDPLARERSRHPPPAVRPTRARSRRCASTPGAGRRGMVPDAYLAAMTVEDSMTLWAKVLFRRRRTANHHFVAESRRHRRRLRVGPMLAKPKHGINADLAAVYLVHGAQRAGIGRRLVAAVAAAQHAHGANGLIVWVIAGNKAARAFYENLARRASGRAAFQLGRDGPGRGRLWLARLRSLIAGGGAPVALH